MTYYVIEDKICFSYIENLPYRRISEAEAAEMSGVSGFGSEETCKSGGEPCGITRKQSGSYFDCAKEQCELVWLFKREPGSCRASFLVNDPALLKEREESVAWLSTRKHGGIAGYAGAGEDTEIIAGHAGAEKDTERITGHAGAGEDIERIAKHAGAGEDIEGNSGADAYDYVGHIAGGNGDPESGLKRKTGEDPDISAIPAWIRGMIGGGRVRAVNVSHPRFHEVLKWKHTGGKKRVNLLALGDVGGMLLTGLHLLGGDVISEIGICDLSEKVTARWEFEENQVAYPWDYDALPEVRIVEPDSLFDCDVFIFAASKGIPPVGSDVKDVRMYQFENNSKIIAQYARQARKAGFKGLFCVVSDPVDPLAKTAFLESNKPLRDVPESVRTAQKPPGERDKNAADGYDWLGLLPEQIQGFGLGVMNARAAYYAKRDIRFKRFLTEGRSFGPHGQDLIVADSIENYDDALSKELTELAVTANLKMRELGFKPYIAPAFSSGAISVLLALRGEWHCGSVFLGGVYMGVKNRYTRHGLETERLPLPDGLYARIENAARNLAKIV